MPNNTWNSITILFILGSILFINIRISNIENDHIKTLEAISNNKKYSDQQTKRINEIVKFINDGKIINKGDE